MPDLRISRVDSEIPEVVPGQFLTASIEPTHLSTPSPSISQASTQLPGLHSRSHSWFSDRKSRHAQDGAGVTTPQVIDDNAAPYQPKVHIRRVFSLVTTIILVVIAFCIGGGIGGGIAGAVMSNQKSGSTRNSTALTSTVYVDQAGCPLINNSPYTSSTGATFLTICATAIVSSVSTQNIDLSNSTQNIDLSNSTQSSFDACLDSCASTTGCVGASWYMFDPTTPSRNSVCFLKSETGLEIVANGGVSVVSGYLKSALPS